MMPLPIFLASNDELNTNLAKKNEHLNIYQHNKNYLKRQKLSLRKMYFIWFEVYIHFLIGYLPIGLHAGGALWGYDL